MAGFIGHRGNFVKQPLLPNYQNRFIITENIIQKIKKVPCEGYFQSQDRQLTYYKSVYLGPIAIRQASLL